jgi:hypothetical protein
VTAGPAIDFVAVDPGLNCSGFAVFVGGRLTAAGTATVPRDAGCVPARASLMAARIVFEVLGIVAPVGGGISVSTASNLLVIEWPRIYVDGSGRLRYGDGRDPNALLGLCAVAGALAANFEVVEAVEPAEWKGQVPKPKRRADEYIVTRRAQKRLDAAECAAVAGLPESAWDAWDAVGLGLWRLGRMSRPVVTAPRRGRPRRR